MEVGKRMNRMTRLLLIGLAALAAAESASAQESPYTGIQGRSIKALSAQEIEDYLTGAGMGLALAAELNGYPGPKHVLELADSLHLSADQRARVTEIFEAMRGRALELGAGIVERERELDSLFAGHSITPDALADATREIAALEGELRGAHLAAHLETAAALSPEQMERYQVLRGYEAAAGHRHRGH
jgi:Spy/CpxP family protein refolding chaperone